MTEKIIFEVILEAVINSITASLPFLKLPVLNPLFNFVMRQIGEKIFSELMKNATIVFIGYQTDQQIKAYDKAAQWLRDHPDEKTAQENFRNTLRELIHMQLPADSPS